RSSHNRESIVEERRERVVRVVLGQILVDDEGLSAVCLVSNRAARLQPVTSSKRWSGVKQIRDEEEQHQGLDPSLLPPNVCLVASVRVSGNDDDDHADESQGM
ncbi:unnamed protein product, partial [Hapterophycus canaliculatus]